jgi:hypothetical protein
VVLPEVSQEVQEELAGLDGSEQEQEGEMEGECLVPVAKGGDYEEEELFLMQDDIMKIHCVLEHAKASGSLLAI